MNKSHFCIILLLISTNVTSLAQKKTGSSRDYSRMDNYLKAGSQNGFSGAIAVIKNGKAIINKGYGLANKNTKTRNTSNTIFDIGSNTKQFTATAILKLVELKKLRVTDSLGQFFKNIPVDKQNITIHQLLTHTAGFTESIGRDFDKITEEQFFKTLFSSKLLSKPGEMYAYSNVGYSILGRIIELASGQEYEAFLSQHLFLPAGMKQTGYLLPKWDTNQISRSYNRGILDSEPTILKYQKNGNISWHLKANGGINATQNDILLWHKALKSNKIISKESFEKLTTAYTDYPSGTLSYAYGWTVRTLENDVKRIAHNGSNGAYAHSLIWFPEKDIFISYATNANSSKVEFVAYAVAKMMLDETYVPKPIEDNVYAYAIDYMKQHSIDESKKLIVLLRENYADDFTNSRLLNSIGNILLMLNEHKDWAIELFKRNVQLYPNDGNLWDSLGDGYKANDQKQHAIDSYQKAVELGYKDSQEKLIKLMKNDFDFVATPIAENVYSIVSPSFGLPTPENRGWNSNSHFVITEKGVLLFDTGSSELIGNKIKNVIKSVTNKPVRWVINSHSHADHWFGNAAFEGDEIEIIASKQAFDQMKKDGSEAKKFYDQVTKGKIGPTKLVYPTLLLDRELKRNLGGVDVEFIFSNDGHSPGDILIWLPKQKIILGGDVLASDRMPIVTSHGNTLNLINTLHTVSKLNPTIVLTGHGKATSVESVKRDAKFLSSIWKQVKTAYENGKNFDETLLDINMQLKPIYSSIYKNYDAEIESYIKLLFEWQY